MRIRVNTLSLFPGQRGWMKIYTSRLLTQLTAIDGQDHHSPLKRTQPPDQRP